MAAETAAVRECEKETDANKVGITKSGEKKKEKRISYKTEDLRNLSSK